MALREPSWRVWMPEPAMGRRQELGVVAVAAVLQLTQAQTGDGLADEENRSSLLPDLGVVCLDLLLHGAVGLERLVGFACVEEFLGVFDLVFEALGGRQGVGGALEDGLHKGDALSVEEGAGAWVQLLVDLLEKLGNGNLLARLLDGCSGSELTSACDDGTAQQEHAHAEDARKKSGFPALRPCRITRTLEYHESGGSFHFTMKSILTDAA